MRNWLVIFSLLVAGCSNCTTDEVIVPAKQEYAWPALPVYMDLSPKLTPCQRAGVLAGVSYWENLTHKKFIQARDVSTDSLSINGIVPKGVIAVINDPMSSPSTLDQVEWLPLKAVTGKSRYLHSAEMRVQGCSLRAFAHEVGHALGMGHAEGASLLMTRVHHPDSWVITDIELQAVIQP